MSASVARTAVRDCYDIPDEVFRREHSDAFVRFLQNWFGDSQELTRRELDLSFLQEMSAEETQLAKALLRRNLQLKYTHIIEGLATLKDIEAIPKLRKMLAEESDLSRRLTLAGSLWKLARDPVFIDYLNAMVVLDSGSLKAAHLHQVLWLDDDRAIDLLIDLLDDRDRFVRFSALSELNQLEFECGLPHSARDLRSQPQDYRRRRNDAAFLDLMVGHLKARNGARTNGW